ncbi:MAG: DUF4124 domain-containing protein [Proteobacteria bacterium]|nr:DUF4124 domain-containing protein [Pseudomonadota bacterium]
MKKTVVLILVMMSTAHAGIYKWTDSEGAVHFGDHPVAGDSATELEIEINNHAGITNSSGNRAEREYLLKKIEENKRSDAEARSKKLAADKKRRKKCDAYKRRYQVHIQSNRTYRMSPDGERVYLSDEQRDARKKKFSKGVAKYCR